MMMIINPHFVYSAVLEDQYYSREQGSMPPQQLMSGQNGPLIGSTVVVVRNGALSNSGLQSPPQCQADVAANATFIGSLIKNCSAVPSLLTLHPGSTPSQSLGN